MSRNQKTIMDDGKTDTTAPFLKTTVDSFIQDRLLDRDGRIHQREECADRLAAATQNTTTTTTTSNSSDEVRYSDQTVLANLDWGIDALEEAISTSNPEAKLARLDHAERMLQVCALLHPDNSTAGVPNSYLSAWAHLNLAFLCKLPGNANASSDAVYHVLEMFTVDPFFARIDFAPQLWESLFLPHMNSVVGWYSEVRHRIVMESIPDASSSELSLTVDDFDDDQLFNDSLILSVWPDQADKLEELERAYGESLDHNTRMFARYYKEVVGGRKGMMAVLPPIAEPPMTPLHEVSRKIPDFVKFGPILPKSAGFAPLARDRVDSEPGSSSGAIRRNRSSITTNSGKESKKPFFMEALLEDNDEENDTGVSFFEESEFIPRNRVILNNTSPMVENTGMQKTPSPRMMNNSVSLYGFSPEGSPNSLTRHKNLSSSPARHSLAGSRNSSASASVSARNKQFSSFDGYPLANSPNRSSSREKKIQAASLDSYSPADFPKTPPQVLSPNLVATSNHEPEQLFSLLSTCSTSPLFSIENNQTSVVSSPNTQPDQLVHFISSRPAPALASPRQWTTSADYFNAESEVRKSRRESFSSSINNLSYKNTIDHVSPSSFYTESEDEVSGSNIALGSSEKYMPRTRPPKDFICPITGQLFNDPVTLETGQTFERRAIEEWLKRGNTTCPITRQLLSSSALPQTNYVLKRLITSWMEQNPELAQEFSYAETLSTSPSPISPREYPLASSTSPSFAPPLSNTRIASIKNDRSKRFARVAASGSPTSVISQAANETIINELKQYTLCLCTSEDLQECETAVLRIARIWKNSKATSGIHAYLSKSIVLNGFVEILSASIDREILVTSIYVLSEIILVDESACETLMSVDSDFDYLAALLINGLAEAVVLIYQLRPTFSQLCRNDLVPALIQVIINKGEILDDLPLVMEPKDAAIAILEQILSGGDENSRLLKALGVISANGLPAIVKCLNRMEGRVFVVSILLCCMRADKRCRYLIAKRGDLLPVLELFHAGDDSTRSICVDFISEIVSLNRRTFRNEILQMIIDEGAFSTMHSLLVYLQMAPMEQQPTVASLLLQLDLLVEPRKMSIYREEAIDAIIEALKRNDFPVCQVLALETLSSLSGRLSASGEPMIEAWLLKIAGVDQLYTTLDKEGTRVADYVLEEEEENAINKWEKRVAFVLCNHDNGAIFKAFEECLNSKSMEMAKSCLVTATWLIHMLSSLPETGVKLIASQCLLNQFIEVIQSSRNLEEKVLATLALKSFISDPDTFKALGTYAKCIYKPLRKLKRCSLVVADMLKAIMNLPSVDSIELWSCTELFEIDCVSNGEVMSLVHSKGRLFSSHFDGTIKVWDAGRRGLRLVQEVHDHAKAVTCLYVPSLGNKLYSGSQDKTIRVWTIGPEEILSVQVHDMREAVQCLTTTDDDLLCFASQGTGVKVYNGTGTPKHVNFHKNVKCLAMAGGDLYCGCTGYSVQEVYLSKCTSNTFYSGTRKLLGKQNIQALCIQDGILYAGGSSVDGTAGKAFSLSRKTVIGSFTTRIDIHCIAVSIDYVFTGTRCGVIEVWLRERLTRVGSIKVSGGANTKVTTLASDADGEMLFSGSCDGKIQVWALD